MLPDLDIKYMTMICRELGLAALIEVCNMLLQDMLLVYLSMKIQSLLKQKKLIYSIKEQVYDPIVEFNVTN